MARNGAVMPSPKQLLVNLTSAPWDAPGSPGRGEAASPSGRRSSPLDLRRKIQVSSPSPPAVPSPLASPSPSQENHTRKVCGAVEVLARALSRLLGAAGGPVAVGSASTCKPRLFGKRALPRSSLWLVSLTVLTLCSLQEERDKEAIVTRHVKGPDVWPGVAGPHQGMWPDATTSGMRPQGMRPDVARCGLMLDVVVVEFGRCIHGQCGPNR